MNISSELAFFCSIVKMGSLMAVAREHNIQLINEQPVEVPSDGAHGSRKYAFVHPKSTGGVLVELYQLNDEK